MRYFNERSEREVRRLQQDNDILKKEVEEIQNQIVSLEAIKTEATEKNEEL
jgi:prefoldin subunit 5